MRDPLKYPALWERTKYVSWPPTQGNPTVRIPHPAGKTVSKSVPRTGNEKETLERCVAQRDEAGQALWGERRWAEMLRLSTRPVAKPRKKMAGPMTGVNHYERKGFANIWVATWYERAPDGSPRRRSKQFSYGSENAQFSTSEQAMQAAIKKREEESARWYGADGSS